LHVNEDRLSFVTLNRRLIWWVSIPLNGLWVVDIGFRARKAYLTKKSKRTRARQVTIENFKRKTDEDPLLQEFQQILKMSTRIEINLMAASLRLSEPNLIRKLLRWNEFIPFTIDGKMIVVDDIGFFFKCWKKLKRN
jgi:hypothetical protein